MVPGSCAGELHKAEQGVRGGVAGPDHGRVPAGEQGAVPAEHVGQRGSDPVGDLRHAEQVKPA